MNQVPWLRSGVGETPADGGCIMQVIDWIHRNEWTDDPPCVHPVFRRLAIRLNDSLDDEGRQKLLDLAPRMMGTATDDKFISARLEILCADSVFYNWTNKYPDDDRLLRDLLDEFDRLTGRTEVKALDYSGVCEAMAAR